ncbi:MAG: hypothetical protein NTX11_02015 [Candidatus Saccharibacteria bacterium]|nr:hypothetical protein [Candidatus Saccharibacteria bacterium]
MIEKKDTQIKYKKPSRKDVLEHISIAKQQAGKGDYLGASVNIAQALNIAGLLGDKKLLSEAKKLSVTYNTEAEKLLTDHSISIDIDKKTKDAFDDHIKVLTSSRSLYVNLSRIASSRLLVPRYDEAVKNAHNIVPVTAQFVTNITYGDNGHLKAFDKFESTWLIENYNIQLNLTFNMLNVLFSRLRRKKQVSTEQLINVLVRRKMYNREQFMKVWSALNYGLMGDYYTSISLLVPIVERTFLDLSTVVGIDTYSYGSKNISTRGKPLSSHILNSKEYQDVWGKDFCIMLDLFLYNEDGYKFRHRVVHGELGLAEYSFTTFNMLLYILIKMSFMITATPAKPKQL